MWTKECVADFVLHNNTARTPNAGTRGQRNPLTTKFKSGQLPSDWQQTGVFPDLKQGSLGSCAVVAVGDNLLQSPLRGQEIDAHDTVFRYNSPMNKYRSQVGRRSTVLYWKLRKDEKDYGQEGQRATYLMFKDESKFFLFGNAKDWASNTFLGMPLLWSTPLGGTVIGHAYGGYKEERGTFVGSASGGSKFAMDVLASGLCERVDLYGYTPQGSAKYFNPEGNSMNLVHIIGLENWMYRVAQEEEMMCVFT